MRYRVGKYRSLVEDLGYVVQRKAWWGWKTIARYWSGVAAKEHGRALASKGHEVKFYI